MADIIQCESSGNPNAVGDNGTSYGIVQIHLVSHENITMKQALNPEWSIDYLAKQISLGNGNAWTCFKLLK